MTVNGADLAVVKTGPALVTEGHNLTYHLAAMNNGPANATGVVVTDTLPRTRRSCRQMRAAQRPRES